MALNGGQGQAVGDVCDGADDTGTRENVARAVRRMAAAKGGWAHKWGDIRQGAGTASSRRLRQCVVDNQPN